MLLDALGDIGVVMNKVSLQFYLVSTSTFISKPTYLYHVLVFGDHCCGVNERGGHCRLRCRIALCDVFKVLLGRAQKKTDNVRSYKRKIDMISSSTLPSA